MPRDIVDAPSPPVPVERPFGEFETRYYEGGARGPDDLSSSAFDHLRAILKQSGATWLSLDVFDTLLIRNHKCEKRRFWEIAALWAAWLTDHHGPSNVEVVDLYRARLRAARICYSCGPLVLSTQEGRLEDIVRIVIGLTGLDESHAEALIEIEIDYEAQNTRLCPLMVKLIEAHRAADLKVVLISDMYMTGADIQRLLAQHSAEPLADVVISSADVAVNKRTGTIFAEVAKRLGASAQEFFHIGDNLRSDFLMPRLFGWRAQHLPIPREEEILRLEDERAFDAEV